jgi:hypothetical protein
MAYSLTRVLADPEAAARYLLHNDAVFGVEQATGRTGLHATALLELTLRPLPALHREGYPTEHVRVAIRANQTVHAFPRDDGTRRYKHRNTLPLRDLCLQYTDDDPTLCWIPQDGLEPLVTLVHRHLMFEEAWRRTGTWPSEDAPHGRPIQGSHPIRTQYLRQEVRRWAR